MGINGLLFCRDTFADVPLLLSLKKSCLIYLSLAEPSSC
ncbi:Uncharacterized protein dnm_051070 [Desulfonema magnum]|uniref:Uncharacterized protein n=1 Tax=Desulfonema magnum TaxID=45655 RepID=A0A975BNP7_9BACT|nr:Uncharacterized protein dnm_051070 [Desulfonema magnum]